MHMMCFLRGVRACRFSCMRVLLIVHVLHGLREGDHVQPYVNYVRDNFYCARVWWVVRFK